MGLETIIRNRSHSFTVPDISTHHPIGGFVMLLAAARSQRITHRRMSLAFHLRAMIMIVVVAASASLLLGTAAPPAQAASWGHCDFSDPPNKTLRTFNRAAGSGFAAGKAVLVCGFQGWDNESGKGYRHIRFRHQHDWEKWSSLMGGSWEGVADWCSAQALLRPAYVTYNDQNDTYAYKTQIQIRDLRGRILQSFYATVVVARTSQDIITAFPSGR